MPHLNDVLGMTDVDDSCFVDVEYQINGKAVPRRDRSTGSIFIVGPVLKVTVQSLTFLGNRVLPVHKQRLEKDERIDGLVRHDFGDLLRLDAYSNGCVSVDDIPTPNYQFQTGHKVKCSDNSKGKINRVFAGKVCVKIESDNMCYFRWFERDQFPMELILNLESQSSISSYNYGFAVVEGEKDQSLDLNPSKLHNFSSVNDFQISCDEILKKKQKQSFIGVYVRAEDDHGFDEKHWGCLKVIKFPADMVSDSLPNVHGMACDSSCVENMLQNLKNCHFEVTDEACYLKHFRLDQKRFSEWMIHITSHSVLFSVTAYRRRLIIERLLVELKLMSVEWIHRILEQKMKDKAMIQWLVEDRRLNQLHDHYRVFMSRFKVRRFQHLAVQWFEFTKNSKMEDKAGFNDFGDLCFEETDYYFDGKPVPFNTPYFKGNVSKISVKNTKLFGDQPVVIQDLDVESETNIVGHNISECLKIDQYNKNSIFIDEVSSKDYQFRVGQAVRYNERDEGVIAQLTANEICIKVGDENMFSFRWISRSMAPKEVTLIFKDQVFFCDFEFKTDIDPSSSATYDFSSIDKFAIPCREISENQSLWRTIRISAKPRTGDCEWTQIREIDYSSNTEAALSTAPKSQVPIERLMTVLLDCDSEIREGERVLRELELPNQREKEWLPLITVHPLLFTVTSYRRRLVIERLIVELKLWNTDWIHRILKQNKGDKSMLRWLVEDREVVRLYDHYRVYMSFKVQSSSLLDRRWLKYEKKTIMSGKTGFDDSDETWIQMTTYEADGEPILPTTASVMGNVRQITAHNEELFGEQYVVLHEFRESPEQKQLADDFVDALKVDRYSNGCIFVDDIPSTHINHTVQLDDGAKGQISRVTAGELCIKIKSDNADDPNMNSYRWVPKTETSLIFRGQSDLSNYQFAVTLGNSDESIQFSHAESHQFSDVKDFMIPCPGLSGYQSGTVINGVYAKPRDGDYQWAPVKAIKYPSSIELAQTLRSLSQNGDASPTIERLITVLLQSPFEIRDSESSLLSLDSELMAVIEHPHIFDVTAYRRKLVIERLMVELKLWKTEWIHRILGQKMNGKPMLQWLVEDRRVSQLYDHYRVFMSTFMVKYSPLLNRRWLVLEMTTKMRGERGFGRPGDACFQLTTYQADGVTIPLNIPTVKGSVRRITARNFKLFGNRPVVLHEFRNAPGQRQMSGDFVDALKVDQYSNGCVFVDDNPSKSQLSEVGRRVRFDDGTKGEITRVTKNRICIKMETKYAMMSSFRWISKAEASKQVTMTFQGEEGLNDYLFAARVEHRDESIKASAVKTHKFSRAKDFVIPCGGIAAYYAGFAVICIYATPQQGDYSWSRIKTLKYSPNNTAVAPSTAVPGNESEEAKVDRLMMALIENEHGLGEWEHVQRILQLESDSDSESESESESELMALIASHPLLCSVTSYRRKLVLERFIVELELMSTELIHRILELKMENKPMLQWLVEDRKVNKLYDHYRVYTSRFTVKHSALLNYRWLRFQKKTKKFGGGFRWLRSVCFERTDYLADGDLIPKDRFGAPNITAVKGDVRQITIENFELFGYQSVVLHEFEEQKGDQYISDDFTDALRCDGEFVFLNHIPSASYPFCVGQQVECNDGRIGTVTRLTEYEICVKFISSGMVSFRWFERENIPLELTLTFRYKDQLKDYQFAVSRQRRNTRNLMLNEYSNISEFQIPCESLHLKERNSIYVFAKPKYDDFKWLCIKTLKLSSDSDLDNEPGSLLKESELSLNAFHFLMWLRQRDLKIVDRARILERFGLKKYQSSQWMSVISNVPAMFAMTAYRGVLLVERLIVEMDLLSIQMVHRMIGQRKNSKTALEYLVEDRKVRRVYDHYRVYTSSFKGSFRSDLLDKIWLEFERNTKQIGGDEWKNAGGSCFDQTLYLIDGVVYPTDSAVCLAGDGSQYCRNSKLFGDRDVAIEIRGLENGVMRSKAQTSQFVAALGIGEDSKITICPMNNSKFGIDRSVELKKDNNWIQATVSRETADKICVKYSDGYLMSFRWIQRDDIPAKIRYFIKNRQKISEYAFAASIGTGDGVPLFYDEFTFDRDSEFAIPLSKLVASSSTSDTVYIYAKPKGKDFSFELIKRIEFELSAVPISIFAVDGRCDIVGKYTDPSIMGSDSKFNVFASSDIVISKTGTVDVCGHKSDESDQSNAESKHKSGNVVIPKYGQFLSGDRNSGANEEALLLVSGGNIVNDGTLQCTPSNGGIVYINADGVFENNGIIDCGEKGSIQIKCAVYKNNGQITPKPEVIYTNKKLNRGAIERLISLRNRKSIKLDVVRHRGNDGSDHPNGLLQKGTEMQYESISGGSPAKDWIVFRAESNRPVFPKNIVFRNYDGSRGLKAVRIEGSTDGRKFVKWIEIENISNDNKELQTFIVDPVSGCFALDRAFTYFKLNIVENHGGGSNMFYEFRMH